MDKDTAVKVNHIYKMYKLFRSKNDRVLDVLGLAKKDSFEEHYALKDVSFEVKRGETVGLIGTNGSGKSTMLKIITGVLTPTDGEVEIDGRISALLELGAGFNMEYTGMENIYLQGTMIGFTKEEVDARLDDILAFADIGDFVYQPCKTYSSGMFVRLAFAVAINIDPEILIVDEALSVGDVFFQAKCYKKFDDFKRAGKTIIFVSHDLSSITRYCDRVVLLNRGIKEGEGSPKDMVDLYKKVMVRDRMADKAKALEFQKNNLKSRWCDHLEINPNVSDYGNKKAQIVDFAILNDAGVITSSIDKGEDYSIKMKVHFNEFIESPIFAFTIRDLKGNDLCGTNTLYEGTCPISVEEGEDKTATFTMHMCLQGGEYLLSFGCTGYANGEFTVYHRLYDACMLTVISPQNTVGFFDVEAKSVVE